MRTATLAECRELVKSELRDAALSLDQPDFAAIVDHYLRQAQRFLWLSHEWPLLWTMATLPTAANVDRYALPPGAEPQAVRGVEVVFHDVVYRLAPGLCDVESGTGHLERRAPAERWWLDAREAGKALAIWPTPPDNSQTIRVHYQRSVGPFVTDGDVSTLDADLISLFAAAELAAARGLPDANVKMEKARGYLRELKGRFSPIGGREFVLNGRRRPSWRDGWTARAPL